MTSAFCSLAAQKTAWPCATVRGAMGEEITILTPPVSFWDGSIVPVFIFDRGQYFELTDDSGVLQHLEISGFKIGDDGRKQIGLKKAVERCGVTLHKEMNLFCKKDELDFGLKKFLAALFAVSNWQYENGGKSTDSNFLISEAELYLSALKPNAKIKHNVATTGISGKQQVFPLQMDLMLYDTVTTKFASSAAMIKKLFDVRSVRENSELEITVVLDDRADAVRSKEDFQIFSQLAHVIKFSELKSKGIAALS
ncbi:MAG: DUF1828 domain-containing protein [Proteobacteria bacterium]|nr:MAG: DUF1828 domain-containing protein [Pseudomonadota bacterium]